MLNSVNRIILRNIQNSFRIQIATIAHQFRTKQPIYYPDRQQETERIKEQLKSQLITDTHEKLPLPKDYYYRVLGLKKQATMQQIKTAYYALAKRFHPDAGKNSNKSKTFQDISNAYHILTDESKRLEYDQMGMVRDQHAFLKNISDVMGGKKSDIPLPTTREELVRSATGETKLELTFLEAAHGIKKNIDLKYIKKCPSCLGKSPKLVNRSNPEMCRKCNGTGQLTKKTPTYTSVTVCDQCEGKRYISRHHCETCDNRGIVLESVTCLASVPSGVKTGDVISIENPKNKQRFTYRIQVQESDYFQRIGNNVYTDKYVTLSEAILGGTFKIRGIYEYIELKVQPGTESHTQVVAKGKGIRTRDEVGDHIITVKVKIPRQLSMKQRQLMLAWAQTEEPAFEHKM